MIILVSINIGDVINWPSFIAMVLTIFAGGSTLMWFEHARWLYRRYDRRVIKALVASAMGGVLLIKLHHVVFILSNWTWALRPCTLMLQVVGNLLWSFVRPARDFYILL